MRILQKTLFFFGMPRRYAMRMVPFNCKTIGYCLITYMLILTAYLLILLSGSRRMLSVSFNRMQFRQFASNNVTTALFDSAEDRVADGAVIKYKAQRKRQFSDQSATG